MNQLLSIAGDQADASKRSGYGDTSQYGNWENFRNATLNELPCKLESKRLGTGAGICLRVHVLNCSVARAQAISRSSTHQVVWSSSTTHQRIDRSATRERCAASMCPGLVLAVRPRPLLRRSEQRLDCSPGCTLSWGRSSRPALRNLKCGSRRRTRQTHSGSRRLWKQRRNCTRTHRRPWRSTRRSCTQAAALCVCCAGASPRAHGRIPMQCARP